MRLFTIGSVVAAYSAGHFCPLPLREYEAQRNRLRSNRSRNRCPYSVPCTRFRIAHSRLGKGGTHEGVGKSNSLRRRLVVCPISHRFAGGAAGSRSAHKSRANSYWRLLGDSIGVGPLDRNAAARDPIMAHCHSRLDRRLLSASWRSPRSSCNRRPNVPMKIHSGSSSRGPPPCGRGHINSLRARGQTICAQPHRSLRRPAFRARPDRRPASAICARRTPTCR